MVEQIDQDTGDGTGGYVSGNGLRTARQYVPDGSITAIEIDRVMNLEYRFDESGRIVGIDENGTLRRYSYGQMGLTMAESAGAVHLYEYDAWEIARSARKRAAIVRYLPHATTTRPKVKAIACSAVSRCRKTLQRMQARKSIQTNIARVKGLTFRDRTAATQPQS